MKKICIVWLCLFLIFLSGCSNSDESETQETLVTEMTEKDNNEYFEMRLYISDTEVPVTWEDNDSVKAIMDMISEQSLTIQMSMYGGFEQVGELEQTIIRDDKQITTDPGDIVLYAGNNIVIFYGSNSWAYTRLGHISDKTQSEMSELLGNGDVVITLSAE